MSFFDCSLFPLFILPTIRVNLKVILLREKGFSRFEQKKDSLAENETRLNYLIFLHHFVLIFTVSANLILLLFFFYFYLSIGRDRITGKYALCFTRRSN